MDPLAGLLDGPRARDAFVLRSVLSPPWALRIEDRAPLTLVAVVRGRATVRCDGGAAADLAAGDVAVLRGPDAYTVADRPGTPPQVAIGPGQVCTAVSVDAPGMTDLGVRTWGNDPAGRDVLLTGTYSGDGEVSRRLLAALPPLLVQPAGTLDEPLLDWLAREVAADGPGQGAVLDRLLDLVLVATVRAWFARPGGDPPGWYRASGDPVVGPALRAMQADPARPWTVAGLAALAGVSRATLARRFTELVGEPPMAFLTSARLALAADLLRDPGTTVGAVARRVGYGSPFALSAAFTRVHGVSPRQHRERVSP
ncbi:cupin domain-containing protein [Blastococcus sp. SYSU D00695]